MYYFRTHRWSYGIVLWELYSLGGSPYPGLPMEDLLKFLESGRRMECPHNCPSAMYKLMLKCWSKVPYQRPDFEEIIGELTLILTENSSQVCELNYLFFKWTSELGRYSKREKERK